MMAARCERRRYIALAHASDDWQQMNASLAFAGVDLNESNAEIIGRMIANEMTLQEAQRAIRRLLDVGEPK